MNGSAAVLSLTPQLFRPRTLAREWDMSPSMVYKLIASGELTAVKVGRSTRVSGEAAADFLRRAGVSK